MSFGSLITKVIVLTLFIRSLSFTPNDPFLSYYHSEASAMQITNQTKLN
ncbi:MAG: hypothetical protein ACTS4T_01190 [Candidatus Hodgkinia cicadicola]